MHSVNTEPNSNTTSIDIDSLLATERILRDRVDASPESSDARRDLAWCLLMQVFVQCGYEECMHRLSNGLVESELPAVEGMTNRPIREILAECLWQANVVPSVSADQTSRIESDRLIALARLAGHNDLVEEAQHRHDTVMRVLIRDLEDGDEHPDSHTNLTQKSSKLRV